MSRRRFRSPFRQRAGETIDDHLARLDTSLDSRLERALALRAARLGDEQPAAPPTTPNVQERRAREIPSPPVDAKESTS